LVFFFDVTNTKEWGTRGACVNVNQVESFYGTSSIPLVGDLSVTAPQMDYLTTAVTAATTPTTCGSACGMQEITVVIKTNVPILSACTPTITIANIVGNTKTANTNTLSLSGANVADLGDGAWTKTSNIGQLKVDVTGDISTIDAAGMYTVEFKFGLQNPSGLTAADSPYQVSMDFGNTVWPDVVSKRISLECERPLFVKSPTFTFTVAVTSAYPCDDNTLTLTLSSDIDIEVCPDSCNEVTITGLSGVTVADATTVTSDLSNIDASATSFNSATGTLKFTLNGKMAAAAPMTLTVIAKNSEKEQAAPVLDLAMSCRAVNLISAPSGLAIISPWDTTTAPCIQHLTNSPGSMNTVTVKLALVGPLKNDCSPSIRIEGLNGESCGETGSQASTFTATSDANFVFSPAGTFMEAGPLDLIELDTANSDIPGPATYDVEFYVTNPCQKQSGAMVSAWIVYNKQATTGNPASTTQSIESFRLNKIQLGVCAGGTLTGSDAKPIKTHAPAFSKLELSSSDATASAANDISIVFAANFVFKKGMGFKIEGLVDVQGVATVSAGSIVASLDSTKGVLTVTADSAVAVATETTFTVGLTNKAYGSGPVSLLVSVFGYTCGCVGTAAGDTVSTIGPYQPGGTFQFMTYDANGLEVLKYDLDGSGGWSASEFAAYAAATGNAGVNVADIDSNGDGLIEYSELNTAVNGGSLQSGGGSGAGECAVDCTDFVPKFQVTVVIDIACSDTAYSIGDVATSFPELVGCSGSCTAAYAAGNAATEHTWTFQDSALSSDQIRSILHRLKQQNSGVSKKNGDLGVALEATSESCEIHATVSKTTGGTDDAFCTALDTYQATKSCFVQVQQYAIDICTNAGDATRLQSLQNSVCSQMLILESVAEHTGVQIDDLSMSVDGKIIVEVNQAGVSTSVDVNDVRRGAHAGLLTSCSGSGFTASSCGGWTSSAEDLPVLDMGRVVQVGTTLRTPIDFSSLSIDISGLQTCKDNIFIDALATSLSISANDLYLSSSKGGYTLNIDIREGAASPSDAEIKTAVQAGLDAVVAAAQTTAVANGGVDSDTGIKAALASCGLATLNSEAMAAAKANGGMGTELGVQAALDTGGLTLAVSTLDLTCIAVPATPVTVTVGAGAGAGGACGNATKTAEPPAPKPVPVDTSSWPCWTIDLSCAQDLGLDCSEVASNSEVLTGVAGSLSGVSAEQIRITRPSACNIKICTKSAVSDSQLKNALQAGLSNAGLVSDLNCAGSSGGGVTPAPTPAPVTPALVSCSAVQSSATPCDNGNYISICFKTNVAFTNYTITEDVQTDKGAVIVTNTYYRTVRIAGLKGSKCGASGASTNPACCHGPSTPSIDVVGDDDAGNLFSTGAWDNTAGTLDVRIGGAVGNHSQVCLEIELENPKCAQEGVNEVTLSIVPLKANGATETFAASDWPDTKRADALMEGGVTWNAQFSPIKCSTAGDLAVSGSCPASPTATSQPGLLAGGAKPMLVIQPQIAHKSISQSSPFPCEANTITVQLAFNVPLLCSCAEAGSSMSGQKVTLSGLTGSLTDDMALGDLSGTDLALKLNERTTGTGPHTTHSSWSKDTGTLVIDLGTTSAAPQAKYSACNLLEFTFVLANGNSAKSAASVSVDVPALVQQGCDCAGGCCNPTCSSPEQIANPSNMDHAPLYIKQGRIEASMCQSTAWPGAENTITVTLSPTINLYSAASGKAAACQSQLTISGMDMACRQQGTNAGDGTCYENATMALAGTDAGRFFDPQADAAAGSTGYFGYTCRETQSIQSGHLQLGVFQDLIIQTQADYVLEFTVWNPMMGQSSPPISISGSTPFLTSALVQPCTDVPENTACNSDACAFTAGDGAPLKVYSPQFIQHEMGQSNPYPCMQNTLTVTLRANTKLTANAVITLTNLNGINEVSKDIVLVEGATLFKAWNVPADATKDGMLAWDAETHKTTLTVIADIPVADVITVSFVIKNPCCHQMSPVVCVKASRITGGCANCNPDVSGATCGSTECGKCVSIARQMMDRDFFTLFDTGTVESKYGYTERYSLDADPVTYGSVQLGDAYPLKIYEGEFIAIDKAIGQSTPYPSQQNTITVTFATTVPLLAGTKVSLSGFRYCSTGNSECYMDTNDKSDLAITTSGFNAPHAGADFAAVLGTTAVWDREDGTLILELASNTVAGTQYVFSFVLTNPTVCAQNPQDITITTGCCPTCAFTQTLSADATTPTQVCGGVATYAQPLRIISPEFVTKNIWQSTPYPCRSNDISVQIRSNVNIKAGTRITIKGLKNTETHDQIIAVSTCDDNALTGEWSQADGELVFALVTELVSCKDCTITFTVKNPCCCQESPTDGFSIAADLNCDSISLHSNNPLQVLTALNLLDSDVVQPTAAEVAPLKIRCPQWEAHSIGQSSSYPCADNKLTVTLAFNVPIVSGDGTTVTLTGIHDSLTAQSNVTIQGHSAITTAQGEFMPAEAGWQSTVGTLKVAIGGDVPAYESITFDFTIINPSKPSCDAAGQPATCSEACCSCIPSQDVYVRADTQLTSGIALTIPGDQTPGSSYVYTSTTARCDSGNKNCKICRQTSYQSVDQPSGKIMMVQVAEIKVRNIAQSTPWPCALNTLTVSLSTNVPFASPTVHCTPLITISGLDDACIISTSVALAGTAGTSTFDGNGTHQGGSLVVSTVNDAPADAVRVFTFQLNNPVNSQPAPLIQIESTGIPVCKTHMIKDCDYDHDNSGTANKIGLTAAEIAQRNTDYDPLSLSCHHDAKNMSGDGATRVRKCARLTDTAVVGSTYGAVFDAHPRDAEPLRIHAPAFITRNIGQNSSYPGAVNRVTVTIRSNVDLPIGSLVTISVLNNSCVTSGTMQLFQNTDPKWNLSTSTAEDPMVFAASQGGAGGEGMWDDIEKMLKLHVVVNITAGSYYTFGFNVQNPLCDQAAQPVCIRAKGFCTGVSCRRKVLVIPRRLMEHDNSRYSTSCPTQGYRAPLLVVKPTITLATLSHSSAWASANNTLMLSLTLNVPLFIKVSPKLTINLGAHGSSTPAGTLAVTFGGMATTAHWDPVAGTLQMDVPMDLDACTNYNMTFTLVNRECQNDPPTTSVAISTGSVCSIARNMWTPEVDSGACFESKQITPVQMQTCSVSSYPLQVHSGPCNGGSAATATFTAKRVFQSSCLPGCNNTITIQLMANVPIPAHSSQHIVVDFELPEDACIVKYNTLPHFAPAWADKTLTLTVEQSLDACTLYNITFTVTNDVAKQSFSPSAQTLISATGPIQIASSALDMNDDVCEKPFEVQEPVFEVIKIGQSSPYPGATGTHANELCVTISTNTRMVAGSAFAIHGLDGAIALDGDLALTGSSASLFESANGTASHGTWNNCEKVLDLNVVSDLGFCGTANLTFCFKVSNPIDAQLCAPVHINATNVATCKGAHKNILVSEEDSSSSAKIAGTNAMGVAMVGDESTVLSAIQGAYSGDACPMVVWAAAFCVKDIGQSSELPCDTNTITITLSSNVPLYATVDYPIASMATVTTDVTIRGLKGAINHQSTIAVKKPDGTDVAHFKDSQGTWSQNSDGTHNIVLKLAADCCQPAEVGGSGVVFKFDITNPHVLTEISPVPTVQARGIDVIQTSMRQDVGAKRPMSIAKTVITKAHIVQSTDMPCQTNTITVSLKGTKILSACKAKLTISGLLASVHSSATIVVNNKVGAVTNWRLPEAVAWANGVMTVPLAEFPSNTDVSFEFEIKNPSAETSAKTVSIMIDAADLSTSAQGDRSAVLLLPSQTMTMPAQSALRPITVAKAHFIASDTAESLAGNIIQSSPYPSKANTITVSLRASVPLNTRCDVTVTIGPLTGACIEDDLASFNRISGLDISDAAAVVRVWDPTQHLLTLKIKADAVPYTKGIETQKLLHFSLEVKNPVNAQDAAVVLAKASGVEMIQIAMNRNLNGDTPSGLTVGMPIDAEPMHVRGLSIPNQFTTRNIGQLTAEPAAANEITITIASNIPLPAQQPKTKVTLSGLVGAKNYTGTAQGSSSKFTATWHQDKASMVLDTEQDTDAGEEIVLKFKFNNPDTAQISPRVYIEASGIAIAPMAMNPDTKTRVETKDDQGKVIKANPGFAAPLAIMKGKLYSRTVHQKSNGENPGSLNMLTFSFKSTVALKSSTSHVALVISGLNGMRLMDGSRTGTPTVAVTKGGEAALITNSSCVFTAVEEKGGSCAQCARAMRCPYLDGSTPNAPKLMVGIGDVPADTEIEFTVTFMNANEAQDCQKLTLETVSCDVNLDFAPAPLHVTKGFEDTNQCPLTIIPSSPFTVKKVCQSVSCTGAVNTITVSLQPKFVLTGAKGSEVTIRGLRGSTTRDSMLTLLSGAPVFESKARWIQSSGSLILKVAPRSTLHPSNVSVVSFDIVNPKYKQEAAGRVEVSASGDVMHEAVCMDQCDGDLAPMLVKPATFQKAAIASSSTLGGSDNVVTITLQPQCTVLCEGRESVITVEGLVGSSTGDSDALPVSMIKGGAGLFMSSADLSLSFTSNCALADNKVVISGVHEDPTGTMLYFSEGACADRYTKIMAFDRDTGCATLDVTSRGWSDNRTACKLGVVSAISVTQGGSGFKSGDFIVDSETGTDLTGKCVVTGKDGAVASIVVTTHGHGYNQHVKVRCPRACPQEQAQQVATCGCGCGCGCNCNNTVAKAKCGEPVDEYGMYSSPSIAGAAKITSVCAWSQTAGRLTCAVQGCVKSSEETVFSVALTNALINQPAKKVNIMASGHIGIPAVTLTGSAMQIKTQGAPGKTTVQMAMLVHTQAAEVDDIAYRQAVAAAAGVETSKVTIAIAEIDSMTALTLSGSYMKAPETSGNSFKLAATVEVEDWLSPAHIAHGMSSERINSKLQAVGKSVDVPEEHKAHVVHTAAESVTAVCKCNSSNIEAIKNDTEYKCTCSVSIDNLPTRPNTTTYILSSDMQCNAHTTVTSVKVGTSAVSSAAIAQAPGTCDDQCGEYHKMLQHYDVTSAVSNGKLDVEIQAEGLSQDFCGAGDYFKAVLVLSY